MNTLLTKVKHATITTREVLIHLRKNGELKRKPYLKYLKTQYHTASNAYIVLQSSLENNETLNIPRKKLTMPVDLVRSEMSKMSASFGDIDFLTEAWHFFQKEMMKSLSKPVIQAVSEPTKVHSIHESPSNQSGESLWDHQELHLQSAHKSAHQTHPQSHVILTSESGFGKLNLLNKNLHKSRPLCIQVLKWAQEGKLILN